MKKLYINCDMGEGISKDAELLPLVNQANIACGAHAGSTQIMKSTMQLALENNCSLGAHPGYEDPENFGRRSLALANRELEDLLRKQLDDFGNAIEAQDAKWHHVKPHGGLYHDLASREEQAELFLELLQDYPVQDVFLKSTEFLKTACEKRGIRLWSEAFLDRGYDKNGQLLARGQDGSLLESKEEVAAQCKRFLKENKAETYCVHGDHQNSVVILTYLHQQLPQWGYQLSP